MTRRVRLMCAVALACMASGCAAKDDGLEPIEY
jgi:hypothetical protein